MSMTDEKVKRINELYHKAKAEGLTEAEKKGAGRITRGICSFFP